VSKSVHQTINAPVYGHVAGGDIKVDNSVHVHSTVVVAPASRSLFLWAMGALVLAVVCSVAVSQVLLPDAPHFAPPTVPMVPVQSTAIKAVGYDPATQQLYITFTSSAHPYTFCAVPPAVHSALMAAPSKGGFYNAHIRGRYGC